MALTIGKKMFNLLKRLFKKKNEWTITYKVYQDGRLVYDKNTPFIIETEQAIDMTCKAVKDQIEILKERSRKMVNENYSFKEIYADESAISEQFRKAKAMDEKEEIELGDIYQNIDREELVVVNRKEYKHANNFKLTLIVECIKNRNNFNHLCGCEHELSEIEFRKNYKKYNPSPERKEMELKLGAVYENREIPNMKAILHRQEGIYVFLIIPEARNDIQLTVNQFKYMYKEWHEPRTLKLEDFNKLWFNAKHNCLDKIISVTLSGKILVIDKTGERCFWFEDYKEFFESYREATQADIDNLTKGN